MNERYYISKTNDNIMSYRNEVKNISLLLSVLTFIVGASSLQFYLQMYRDYYHVITSFEYLETNILLLILSSIT